MIVAQQTKVWQMLQANMKLVPREMSILIHALLNPSITQPMLTYSTYTLLAKMVVTRIHNWYFFIFLKASSMKSHLSNIQRLQVMSVSP